MKPIDRQGCQRLWCFWINPRVSQYEAIEQFEVIKMGRWTLTLIGTASSTTCGLDSGIQELIDANVR